ncbi:MAG: M3 family oligoendopeptidase [Acidimicrobiia bacterium]|nr:M3 family oligoendopeptidase [Acidimicrobiia bacterium]
MAVAFGAEDVRWDLTHLYGDPDGEEVHDDLIAAEQMSEGLHSRLHGRVAELDGVGLADAVEELQAIQEHVEKAQTYAFLHFATDTSDPERGAFLQHVEEHATEVATKLLFFELEWAAVPDERAERLLADPALDEWRHFLNAVRRFRPHLLTEPEEKIVTEKAVTGRSAWVRLFTQVTDSISVDLDGDQTTLEQALAKLYLPDRAARQRAGSAVTAALQPGLPVRTYILNTILADHALDDRMRHYSSWIAARNLGNEISDETVQALVDAVTSRYDIPARWYRLKGRLLGIDQLNEHDRYAPLTPDEAEVSWEEARDTVLDAYRSFSPEMADIASGFFDGFIDAPPQPGKQGGAFSHPAVPSAHPYVMLNYTGRRRDVMTLAHELGHGVHQVLANKLGLFNASTPLTLAETASIFGETVTFGRILSEESAPEARLALVGGRIEDIAASIFRQVAMNRFEDAVHNARRDEGELSSEVIADHWIRTQRDMFGDSLTITDEYRSWWSYIPHFIHTPGYVYAYAFGNLLALAVYARYEKEGSSFVPSYLKLLSSGGSDSPDELGRLVGVDLTDPGFWSAGLQVVDELVSEAESLAEAVQQTS